MPHSRPQSRLIVAAFIGVLWLICVGTWLNWGQFNPANERRALAPRPRLDAGFPQALNAYVRDHFGFRGWFVTLNAMLRSTVLHTSTTPNVLIGGNGFLYFAGEGALENYTGAKPMTDCELESWVQLFERRAKWMAAEGIPFVVAVAPNKETVYPEWMPVPRTVEKSRMDRFIAALRTRTRIPVVDLRDTLIAHKPERRTYLKTDTHWSQWGAYWAYRDLLPQLSQAAPITGADLQVGTLSRTMDLNRMLGLNGFTQEQEDTFAPPHPPRITGLQDDPLMTSVSDTNPAAPNLLFIRDSFGAALLPFLGVHYSRIHAPNTWTFDPALVAQQKPAAVLLEIVERRLNDAPPADPEEPVASDPRFWIAIDEPATGANLAGTSVKIGGWAIAAQPHSVERVEVLIDNQPPMPMTLHLPRPDVAPVIPGQRDSATAGVELVLDTRRLSTGRHAMRWKVTNSAGQSVDTRAREFCVAN